MYVLRFKIRSSVDHPLSFNLFTSLCLIWASCRKQIVGSCFLIHSDSLLFYLLFIYFEMESHSVTQTAVEWHDLGCLQPLPPGFKWYSCLSLLNNWDYRCRPLCPANFCIFSRDGGLTMLTRLLSDFWPHVIHLPRPPKVTRLYTWATVPSQSLLLIGVFRPFAFKEIIFIIGLISIVFITIFYLLSHCPCSCFFPTLILHYLVLTEHLRWFHYLPSLRLPIRLLLWRF